MLMKQSIGLVALVVRDYDEAIEFYVNRLGFALVEDTPIEAQNKRWVVVAPPGSSESRLLLARAVGEEQSSRIGNQTGGRVLLFLNTDNFWRDFREYQARGVVFVGHLGKRATEWSQSSRIFTAISGTCCSQGNRHDEYTRAAFRRSSRRRAKSAESRVSRQQTQNGPMRHLRKLGVVLAIGLGAAAVWAVSWPWQWTLRTGLPLHCSVNSRDSRMKPDQVRSDSPSSTSRAAAPGVLTPSRPFR